MRTVSRSVKRSSSISKDYQAEVVILHRAGAIRYGNRTNSCRDAAKRKNVIHPAAVPIERLPWD